MSDENPPEADAPRDAEATSDATVDDATEATPDVAPAAPTSPKSRSSVEVPRWVALVLAAVVLVGVGFAIGWFAAPGGGTQVITRPSGRIVFPGGGAGGAGRGAGGPGGQFGGRAGGAFLGVETSPTSGSSSGVSVVSVESGSPAAQAGLQAGDVITAVNGSSVTSLAQLSQDIVSHQPGDQVTITYTRNGTSSQVSVKLGTRPAPSATG
jgi:membrane-associated protease RseP (regulator of RpoE activity)